MATDESSGRNPSGNPTITDIEAAHVGVRPEFDLNAVELEVVDQDGKGFRALLGWEQGLRYPAVPTFRVPSPTTTFRVGLLLLAGPSVPRVLFIVPVLWALVGSMAAMTLGLTQDLMLWLAGIAAVWAIGARAPTARLHTDAR